MKREVKLITCAGYYGTGSSAITDLLGEFDNVFYMGDFEFRFVQDPGGISDLDYNLVENYHRHNSGHALKRFKKNVDFWSGNILAKKYEKYFNGMFKSISYDYIAGLTLFKFRGYWHQDVIDKGYWFYVLERVLEKSYNKFVVPILYGKKQQSTLSIHILKNEYTYVPRYDFDCFYKLTKEYINKLFTIANKDNKDFIMADQLVPPSNTSRFLRYFDNLKIIVVDRDPRDIFILEKRIWKGGVVPVDDILQYCEWFKTTRKHKKYENDDPTCVLRINFEDLVYHFEHTKLRICDFLGIDINNHSRPFTHFDPKISIKNTRLWENYPELEKEINIIREQLAKYCYSDYND